MSTGDMILDGLVILISLWACWAKWGAPYITKLRGRLGHQRLLSRLLSSEFLLLARHNVATPQHIQQVETPQRRVEAEVEGPVAVGEESNLEDEDEDDEGEADSVAAPSPTPAPTAQPAGVSLPTHPVYLQADVPDPQLAHQRALEMWQVWMRKGMSSALHLIVIGQTGAGKTTVLQVFVADLVMSSLPVVVCDPDAAAGDWPGTQVFGAGDDFQGISQAFKAMQRMAQERRQARAQGQREFPPFWCVLDEYADIKDECPNAGAVVENALRRWRKLNMHLVIGVQDTQVKTMGFERRSSLLNHARIVSLRLSAEGRRFAQIDDGPSVSIPKLDPPRGPIQEPSSFDVEEDEGTEVSPVGPLDILHVDVTTEAESVTADDLLDTTQDKDEQIRIMLAHRASYADIASRLKVATTRISKVKKDFMLET